MKPRITDGDVLFVQHEIDQISDGKIYVFSKDGQLHVKRLLKVEEGKFIVKSDNPMYKPFEITSSNTEIIGRVTDIWAKA